MDAALTLGQTTIITPICPDRDRVEALMHYLRSEVAPDFVPGAIIKCRNSFRFDQIKSLHLCSFVIIHEVDGSNPCLVFEATFDGPREEFLDDLLRVAAACVHEIYQNCEGYPASALILPELIKDYLRDHDAGVSTFFSGNPGRSVAQIKGEQQIREQIVAFLTGQNSTKDAPTTFLGLQRELQHQVIRAEPANHWAEQSAAVPWEVTQRKRVAAAIGLAALVLACCVGVLLLAVSGFGPRAVDETIISVVAPLAEIGGWLLSFQFLSSVADLLRKLQLPILLPLVALTFVWLIFRGGELYVRFLQRGDPRREYFPLRFLVHIFVILRYAVVVFIAGFAVLLFDEKLLRTPLPPPPTRFVAACALVAIIVIVLFLRHCGTSLKLRVQFQMLSPGAENCRRFLLSLVCFSTVILIVWAGVIVGLVAPLPPAPNWTTTFAVVAAALVSVLLLRYCAKLFKLGVQFRERSRTAENRRGLALFLALSLTVIFVVSAGLVVGLHVLEYIAKAFGDPLFGLTRIVLVVTIYVVAGILTFYVAALFVFLVIRGIELADRRRFAAATELTKPADSSAYEREEGGVNKYQNHLASLTYVKPGLIRVTLLRITLFVIGLLARLWYNQGDLGGIPTILAARWVLIDNGRRLLFFTNYAGGWESYLNEFIDMGAVNGLNAIWTNTFVKTDACGRRYAFPATEYFLWKGAQDEQPFKAYVRQSQIETLVWYSAYPTLTITNINTNTELRQALFTPLAPSELDAVFLKAGL
jgi:hypothetical protein